MKQLSGMDASFLYFETTNAPMHVGGVAIFDQSTAPGGAITFKQIMQTFQDRLHLARAFRERVVRVPMSLDHPYWIEDPDFDIEFHIRHIALPKPGDWRQLCIQAARLHSRPLDQNHPLWEFYVIEGLDNVAGLPKGSYAILSKIHHAAIDGVSGSEMTAAVYDLAPDASRPAPDRPWVADREPSSTELLVRSYINNLVNPLNFGRVVARSVPALAKVGMQLGTRELKPPALPGRVPRTRFNDTITAHRVFEGRSFDLAKIRAIKNVSEGATVNDVVLTVCGGALRKYLESKGELPDESLIAMAPVSVRDEKEQGSAGNKVSGMSVAVRSDIEDPLDRLEAVHAGTQDSKALTNAIGARLMTDYTQFIPSSTAGLAARLYSRLSLANRISPFFNCVITNVPGPQVPLYSTGARLVTQFGLGPIFDGVGLIFPVFSYCGQITISVTACREMMPDPAFFASCLEDSFDELLAAALPEDAAPAKEGPAGTNWTHDADVLASVGSGAKARGRKKAAAPVS